MTRNKSKREGFEDTVDMISQYGISPFDPINNNNKQKSNFPFEIPLSKHPSFNPFITGAPKMEKQSSVMRDELDNGIAVDTPTLNKEISKVSKKTNFDIRVTRSQPPLIKQQSSKLENGLLPGFD